MLLGWYVVLCCVAFVALFVWPQICALVWFVVSGRPRQRQSDRASQRASGREKKTKRDNDNNQASRREDPHHDHPRQHHQQQQQLGGQQQQQQQHHTADPAFISPHGGTPTLPVAAAQMPPRRPPTHNTVHTVARPPMGAGRGMPLPPSRPPTAYGLLPPSRTAVMGREREREMECRYSVHTMLRVRRSMVSRWVDKWMDGSMDG